MPTYTLEDTKQYGRPLQAGAGSIPPSSTSPDEAMLSRLVTEAVKKALDLQKREAKRDREDTGSGSTAIGELVRTYRLREGVTQRSMGDRVGLHATTIGKIEAGERGMSLTSFAKIASGIQPDQRLNFANDVITTLSGFPGMEE